MMDTLDEALAVRRAQWELPSFARRRELRRRHGLTQADIADVVGVDPTTVVRWESSTRTPQGDSTRRYLAVLQRLADELGESL